MRGKLKTAAWPLQQAIYAQLTSDTVLMSMINGVYDEIEEGSILPYVQIGNDTTNPYDTKTDYGEETTLTMHVWSAGPGKTETKRIMDAMLQALTSDPLTLSNGFIVEGFEREFLEFLQDAGAYHGVCRFRVYIKQN